MTNTSTCTNKFLEADGFCVVCGHNHFKDQLTRAQIEKQQKRAQTRTSTSTSTAASINDAIEADPIYRTARCTAKRVLKDFGLEEVSVIFRNKVSNSSATCTQSWQQISFGYQMLKSAAARGETDYKSCSYLINYKTLFGTAAAHHIALHECAHVIVFHFVSQHAAPHGAEFQDVLKQLLAAYPYTAA